MGVWWGIELDLDALIAKGRAALDNVEPVDQEVLVAGEIVTIRLWPLAGGEWRNLTTVHPPRAKSVFDQNAGYNMDAVTRAYPKVYIVDGDTVTNVTVPVDPEEPEHLRWHDIYDILDGPDMKNLASAVWGLNEYEHQKRVAAAGKALAGGRKKKRS